MGYSYESSTGRLCCDSCGDADGTTRKRRCPAGWCPSSALCAGCWADPVKRAEWAAYHVTADCAGQSREYGERKAREAALLAAGEFVRVSAVGTDAGVRVTFKNAAGTYADAYVTAECYRSVPTLEPATPATFGLYLAPTQEERDNYVRAEVAHWLETAEQEGISLEGVA